MKSLLEYVRDRAELRNKLLYAKSEGYIEVSFEFDRMFEEYKRNVFRILKVYLLIDPYSKRQLLVEQALQGFLRALDALPKARRGESLKAHAMLNPDGSCSLVVIHHKAGRRRRSGSADPF